jgi:hypothetical protein
MLEVGDLNAISLYKDDNNVRVCFCTEQEANCINKGKNKLGRVWAVKYPERIIVSCSIKTNKKEKRITFGKNKELISDLLLFVEENYYLLNGYWNTDITKAYWDKLLDKFVKLDK